MRVLTLAVLLLATFSLRGQSFEETIQQAHAHYLAKDYHASGQTYTEAFAMQSGDVAQYYNAACSWALAGDTTRALDYLQQAATLGYRNAKHLQKDSDLDTLHATAAWPKVVAKVEANLAEFEKDYDHALKDRLERIYLEDQVLRQLYREAGEKFGKDSEEMDYYWEVIGKQDSLNELAVIDIIEEYGWVGQSLVGGKANMTVWLVIQHADVAVQEKYLPLLQESVAAGQSSGSHLALLEDRILMYNDRPQKYGSQIRTDPETGQQVIHEVMDPEYVDQRRSAVGLGPLADYVKQFGLEWTVPQKQR